MASQPTQVLCYGCELSLAHNNPQEAKVKKTQLILTRSLEGKLPATNHNLLGVSISTLSLGNGNGRTRRGVARHRVSRIGPYTLYQTYH